MFPAGARVARAGLSAALRPRLPPQAPCSAGSRRPASSKPYAPPAGFGEGPSLDKLPTAEDLMRFQELLGQKRKNPIIPLLVVDAMLPNQRLRFGSNDTRLEQLANSGEVGVIGLSPLTQQPMQHGVTAALARVGEQWELVARRHVRVLGPAETAPDGIHNAIVEVVEDEVTAADVEVARQLLPLVDEWRRLVETTHHERYFGQVKGVIQDLGPMPPPEAAGHLAIWVAALVNPLPGLGVAMEIRPDVLRAATVAERLEVTLEGIRGSIGHVSGREPLF